MTDPQRPPRSSSAPVRRSTRDAKPTTTRASTGVRPATASSPSKGGGGGNGGAKPPTKKPEQPRWKRILMRVGIGALIAGFLSVAAVAVALMVVYARLEVPDAADVALAEASTIYWADGETPMGRIGETNREIIAFDSVPSYVPNSLVAAEDRSFYTNPGVDFTATVRALYNTIILGNTQGGSTITQQYVERYYVGETTTSIPGKIKEALLALKVDSAQSKEEVLGNYMNTIYFGRGAYGMEAAAKAYYGKSAADMTVSEAAMLAGIVPAPSAWDPRFSPEKAEQRWNYVLDGLVEIGEITQAERDAQEFPETIDYQPHDTFGGPEGYILRAAINEAMGHLELSQEEIEQGGFTIVTTIQQKHQQSVEDAVAAMPDDHADNLFVAASTVDAATGAITAMYGGEDYLTIQRNAVTQDIAQAGSTFKPFAMIAGLENGFPLTTTYTSNDSMTIEGFENPVRNFAGVNYGSIDMVRATQDSVNTYYVQLARDVGPDKVMETAIKAGVPEDTVGLDANPANVLGTASPHNIDMAHAFSTMADGGVEKEPFLVQTVLNPDKTTAFEHQVEAERVFDEDVIADTTYAMQQVIENGSGTTAKALGRPIAGKTGTSNDNRSAWFVAFTPQIVGAVTLYQSGEDGSVEEITPFGGYPYITGATVPADIWTAMMGPILEDYDVVDFPPRADVHASVTPSPTHTDPTPSVTPSPTETAEPIVTPSPTPTQTTPPVSTPTPSPTQTTPPVTTPTPAPSVSPSSPGGQGQGGGNNP